MSNVRQKGSFLFSHCFGNCKQNLEHSHAAASSLTVNQTPNLYVVYIYIKGRKSFVSKNPRKCQMGLSFTCTASPVHLINSNDCSIKWLLSTEAAPDAPLWLPQAGFWQQPTCLCAFCRSRRKAPGRGRRGLEPLFICSTWSFGRKTLSMLIQPLSTVHQHITPSTGSLCFTYAHNTYLESRVSPSFFPGMSSQLSIPYHLSVTLSWRSHLQYNWVYACTHRRTHTLTYTHHIPSLLPIVSHHLLLINTVNFMYLFPVSHLRY